MKTTLKVCATVGVVVAISNIGITSASAMGSISWATLCAGYTGKSWYTESSGVAYAVTAANDDDEVGAAVRYYGGQTSYTKGYGYALRSRAAVSYGGYHQSYCFPGTQTKLT